MDYKPAAEVAAQIVVPLLLSWPLWQSIRWCKRYERLLERDHRLFLESTATFLGIPLVNDETTEELWKRMMRLQRWRQGALTPEERARMDEP